MKIMLNVKRLSQLMDSQGFGIRLVDPKAGRLRFGRLGRYADLYEHVWILAYGKGHDVVASWSVVAVTAGPFSCEGLCIERFQKEICSEVRNYLDPAGRPVEDSFSPISSDQLALEWEKRLASFSPDDVRRLADMRGLALLKDTESVRAMAKRYVLLLRRINRESNADYLAEQLKPLLTNDQLRQAERLADIAVTDPGLLSAYQIAAMLLQMFGEEVEGRKLPFDGQTHHGNLPLIWRIWLILDWLLWRSSAAEIDSLLHGS